MRGNPAEKSVRCVDRFSAVSRLPCPLDSLIVTHAHAPVSQADAGDRHRAGPGERDTRAGIASIASLREASQSELVVNRAEIEAQANALFARFRQIDADILARRLRCASCDGAIPNPKRISRRYCSARCRQRARRLWLRAQP